MKIDNYKDFYINSLVWIITGEPKNFFPCYSRRRKYSAYFESKFDNSGLKIERVITISRVKNAY